MSGINYDLKKIRGVALDVDGVLSPSVVPIAEDGRPGRMLNVKDGLALKAAVEAGLHIAVITGGSSEDIVKRCELLGIHDVYINVADKLPVLKNWLTLHHLDSEETAYMGDDIPDLKCMRFCGLPCSPYDAAHEARETSVYVSRFSGGYGCVRDLLEQILRAREQWPS